ncbi:MAG TPA: ATP-binding protein [Chloroflexia bacterium]|nr:ATP-binding protein [Chloroflexia bacterium]
MSIAPPAGTPPEVSPPLPPLDPAFSGRDAAVAHVMHMIRETAGPGGTVMLVGPDGSGKTQLALAVAAQIRPIFSNRQVFVDARGSRSTPLPTECALAAVIHCFYPQFHLPARRANLEGIYRGEVLRDTETLILADDVPDATFVTALRPPRGCVLLVTSRRPLVVPGSHTYFLDPLPLMAAADLLHEKSRTQDADVRSLARDAAGLPLVLRLIAADRIAQPDRPLGDYQAALDADQRQAVAPFALGPERTVVRVLTVLWERLPALERWALAHLSIFAADFDLAAAEAMLIGAPVEITAVTLLDQLQRRQLLDHSSSTNRYQLHRLIQAFAAQYLDAAEANAAWWRYAQHYTAVAQDGQQLFSQAEESMAAGDYEASLRLSRASAQLFTTEQAHLLAVEAWLLQADEPSPARDQLLLKYMAAVTPMRRRRFAKRPSFIPGWRAWLAAAERQGDMTALQTARTYLGRRYLNRAIEALPEDRAVLLPTDLLPGALELAWSWNQAQCQQHWPGAPDFGTDGVVRLPLRLADKDRELELFFADPNQPDLHLWYEANGEPRDLALGAQGLFCIRTCLQHSQSFFGDSLDGENVYDVLPRVWEEFHQQYAWLVSQYSAVLGPPVFTGARYILANKTSAPEDDAVWVRNTEFPEEQWESPLTYWVHPAGRLQIGLHHEDKESPIEIWLSSYAPVPHREESPRETSNPRD